MLILDYRTNEIKNIKENELSFIAPKCYVRVIESEHLNGVYVYVYSIKDTSRFISWSFSIQEVQSSKFNFCIARDSYLKSHNLTCEDVELYDKLLYLNTEAIGKCQN